MQLPPVSLNEKPVSQCKDRKYFSRNLDGKSSIQLLKQRIFCHNETNG